MSRRISSGVTARPLLGFHSWRFTPLMMMRSPFISMILSLISKRRNPVFRGTTSITSPSSCLRLIYSWYIYGLLDDHDLTSGISSSVRIRYRLSSKRPWPAPFTAFASFPPIRPAVTTSPSWPHSLHSAMTPLPSRLRTHLVLRALPPSMPAETLMPRAKVPVL